MTTEILGILNMAHSPLHGFDMRPWSSSVERSTRPPVNDGPHHAPPFITGRQSARYESGTACACPRAAYEHWRLRYALARFELR